MGEPGAPGGADAGATAAAGAGSTAGGKYVPPSKRGKVSFLSISPLCFYLSLSFFFTYLGADAVATDYS